MKKCFLLVTLLSLTFVSSLAAKDLAAEDKTKQIVLDRHDKIPKATCEVICQTNGDYEACMSTCPYAPMKDCPHICWPCANRDCKASCADAAIKSDVFNHPGNFNMSDCLEFCDKTRDSCDASCKMQECTIPKPKIDEETCGLICDLWVPEKTFGKKAHANCVGECRHVDLPQCGNFCNKCPRPSCKEGCKGLKKSDDPSQDYDTCVNYICPSQEFNCNLICEYVGVGPKCPSNPSGLTAASLIPSSS